MVTQNYYQGNSIFRSLSSVFGNPTSGNTAESVPVSSSFIGKVEGFMKKQIFGLDLWVWIIIAVVIAFGLYMVMG